MFRDRGVFSQENDEASLDILWLRDESLEESNWGRSGRLRSRFKPFNTFKPFKSLKAFEGLENLRDPEVVAQEIVKLQADARSRDGHIVETCCSKCSFWLKVFLALKQESVGRPLENNHPRMREFGRI